MVINKVTIYRFFKDFTNKKQATCKVVVFIRHFFNKQYCTKMFSIYFDFSNTETSWIL